MREITRIPVSNLLFDINNPRLHDIQANQTETIRAIASQQKGKLLELAKDIVEYGTDPSNVPIVRPVERGSEYYIVPEGNRRIAAIKILENTDLIIGAVDAKLHRAFVELSKDFQKEPIKIVTCVILDEEEDINHWIQLRHTGENKGAGVVKWGSAETARFKQRSGSKEIHIQVLEFLESRGDIKSNERRKVPITSLQRLLTSPYVRTKLGIDLRDGEIVTRYSDNQVAKGLKRVVRDLATGAVPVKKIYTKEDKIQYIDNITSEDLPNTSRPRSTFHILGTQPSTDEPSVEDESKSPSKIVPSGKQRSNLIPRDYAISISQSKVNDIYHELRKLDIEEFTNAVSVLLRVFLELSLDVYVDKHHIASSDNMTLAKKIREVAAHLKVTGKINEQHVKSISHVIQKDNLLASTLTTLHQYVHNPYFSPGPSDLRATWNSLEFFITAMWK
ncbi:MAG: hypothetical protein DCC56_14190 [Anaerolineae bacterium]|nr:MAG: hypothetical protein DCC56_14190 [Anaerolineae bacterium]WKZ44315.1 MAG: hypothetical protein QY302_00825 [Anaerolineales bacterium]